MRIKNGKPQKLRNVITKEQIEKAYQLAKNGNTIHVLCERVGVSYKSYCAYKAKQDKGEYINDGVIAFLDSIRKGLFEYFELCENSVTMQISIEPKFALEVLSRRLPKIWGKKDYLKQDISVKTYSEKTKKEIEDILKNDGKTV